MQDFQPQHERHALPQTPRVIIHGGAGNISRGNLPPALWQAHRHALLAILHETRALLRNPDASALDAAVLAVRLLELNPLFNAGKGAVFTRAGSIELEASVMVSRGFRKRGAAVSLLKHVKSPISLAAEVLRRGENPNGGGALRHEHLSGREAEELAGSWGLDLCDSEYFWTRKRWEEHRRGLEKASSLCSEKDSGDLSQPALNEHLRPDGSAWATDDPWWDGHEYLPQGTVGCVVMDRYGVLAVATSTGGLTNKLPGRIGDTPTFGAGFWAEEWQSSASASCPPMLHSLLSSVGDCLPQVAEYRQSESRHGVAMSGTGNGDSFLRISAVHQAAARARFGPHASLAKAVSDVAGPGGELQRSAGRWWSDGFEGQGGIIGIEDKDGRSSVVFDFNCGGMFRCWIDNEGEEHCMVFHEPY